MTTFGICGRYIVCAADFLFHKSYTLLMKEIYPLFGIYSVLIFALATYLVFKNSYTKLKYLILTIPIQYMMAHNFGIGGKTGQFFFMFSKKIAAFLSAIKF